MLGINPNKALELARSVDEAEGRIDEEHLKVKISFIKNSEKVDPAVFMVLKDLADSIEHAADMCADIVDYIRVLAAGEI